MTDDDAALQIPDDRHDQPKVLVVEDDADIRKILELFLSEKGFHVKAAESGARALDMLGEEPVELILSDVRMPGMTGLELLRVVRERDPEIQLVLMSAYSCVKDAVQAIQLGAADYVEKPIDFRRLERVLQTVLEKRQLRHRTRILEQQLQGCVTFEGMVARSRQMLEIFAFIERLARYPTTALVTGESGTGKELVARALHGLSPRRDRPYVTCNCTTLAPTLLESELFGHVRGAFTGADRDRKGLFEAAHGGSIFLDEIGELPLGVQVKLLRVLENREIKRIGSPEPIHIDIRVIAATNRDLPRAVAAGTFREDLFFRLHVIPLTLPPLRERREDIPRLAEFSVHKHSLKLKQLGMRLAPEALECLQLYDWPGNVRELENVIERAVVLSSGMLIQPEDLALPAPENSQPLAGAARHQIRLEAVEQESLAVETEQNKTVSRPVSWTGERDAAILRGMETHEPRRPRVGREPPLNAWLRLATTRLAEAERERLWAIVAAHDAGLSIRQIAAATGLSRSRIHQLLQDDDARESPAWLTHWGDRDLPADGQPHTDHPAFYSDPIK
jgi:DNA-binding NtrC family response regulator